MLYFRRKVPLELRAQFGKTEIWVSLGTANVWEARQTDPVEGITVRVPKKPRLRESGFTDAKTLLQANDASFGVTLDEVRTHRASVAQRRNARLT